MPNSASLTVGRTASRSTTQAMELRQKMTSTKNKKIALIQMSCEPSTAANLDKAADRVREAARAGANIICLPELFRAQYFCQREEHALFDTAESIPGPSTERLSAIVREEKVVVIASLFERRAPGLYHNTAAILDGTIAPETALRGANTLFYPTAIGWHPAEKAEYGEAQYSAWQTMQRAHAIANGVFVGAVNRVGFEHGDVIHNGVTMKGPEGPGLEFWGGSFIADPFGRVIAQASHDKEEILTAEIDLKLLEDTRRNWPFLRDRRIDAYGGITSRFID